MAVRWTCSAVFFSGLGRPNEDHDCGHVQCTLHSVQMSDSVTMRVLQSENLTNILQDLDRRGYTEQ